MPTLFFGTDMSSILIYVFITILFYLISIGGTEMLIEQEKKLDTDPIIPAVFKFSIYGIFTGIAFFAYILIIFASKNWLYIAITIFHVSIAIIIAIIVIRRKQDRKKAREFINANLPSLKLKINKLNEQYKDLNNEIKNIHLTELKRQLDQIKKEQNKIIPGTSNFTYFDFIKNIPSNAFFLRSDFFPDYQNKNNFPLLLITSPDKERPFGEFTAYVTQSGKCFHSAIWCSSRYNSTGFKPVYIFDVIQSSKKPCSKCCDPHILLKSKWFFELQDNIKFAINQNNNIKTADPEE